MSVRHAAVRSLRPGRLRAALGVSVVGAALALGGAFTAHADTNAPDAPEAEKAHSGSPAASTSAGKHAKPYVSGSETPALTSETDVPKSAKPAQPYVPGSETDVPKDAKPAQPYVPGSETDVPKDAKPAQPYVPGSETDVPKDAKPAQPYVPGSETDVPKDAKPAQPAQRPATPAH
ncbi:hypothetical protein [Streptomyces sp. NRRL B-24085]|uniref:hypothetical protein n=1 Tax=Streptomyces sp. NRRL B-24085 TaxID=1709476 RepID=UPI0006B3216A|nr:hypothetical protein [Streptomyces sp. NRRL B-24085]